MRAYREFVENFGKNFTPPPSRGNVELSYLTADERLQQQRAHDLAHVCTHIDDAVMILRFLLKRYSIENVFCVLCEKLQERRAWV